MTRLLVFDNLRGIAFLFMIIHHVCYFYDRTFSTNYANNKYIDMSGTIARTLFIFLAGISLSLSNNSLSLSNKKSQNPIKKRVKRSLEIGFHALIITGITYLYYPDYFIRFGILHFISLATLLCSFVVPYPKITIIVFILSLLYKPPNVNPIFNTIFGPDAKYNMMDWFPIFPWISLMLCGVMLGQNMDMSLLNIPLLNNNNILTTLGQNALELYTGHVVLLIIVYNLMKHYLFLKKI